MDGVLNLRSVQQKRGEPAIHTPEGYLFYQGHDADQALRADSRKLTNQLRTLEFGAAD